jgi:corrinoid protein of di/trimethylamine methyltransferase
MDFHNEREVEQAMRIVEEYQKPIIDPSLTGGELRRFSAGDEAVDKEVEEIISKVETEEGVANQTPPPLEELGEASGRILLLDGGMGTMIQQYRLREEDFRGCRFAQHPIDLKGCNDVLSLTAPFVVGDIHRKYLEAGADIIETNTFNAQRISMGDYGLQNCCRDINLAAARLARQCADEFSSPEKPRYVAGSIGPTSRTTSMTTSGEPLDRSLLRGAYEEQAKALADGGVDLLLIETIFDTENARIAIEAARKAAPQLPLMLSFSVSTPDGHNMLGQSIVSFLQEVLDGYRENVFSVGINCVTDVAAMIPLVRDLARFGTRVSLYPNSGMPDGKGHYSKTPAGLLADVWPLLEDHCLNIIGGCCGTTDAHIRLMAKAIEPVKGIFLSPHKPLLKESVAQSIPQKETQGGEPVEDTVSSLFSAILQGKADDAVAATRKATSDGAQPQDLINGQMIRAMSEVGRRFQEGQAFVPQLLMAGRAMKAALELLKPMLAGSASTSLGKVVIGTVKGDLHDIGKNLVASMLEGCGFEVVNIGIDVSADAFIQAVRENRPDILCMSALLTTTMGYMKEVIDALEAAGIRDQVKVMVGGAPVTQGFADEIGADGYSDNANSAVTVAKQLLGKL